MLLTKAVRQGQRDCKCQCYKHLLIKSPGVVHQYWGLGKRGEGSCRVLVFSLHPEGINTV